MFPLARRDMEIARVRRLGAMIPSMVSVDPAAAETWRMLAERARDETDPRRRTMLAAVARHVVAEVAGDLDELLETLVDDPQYRFWGRAALDGPKGRDAVIAHYEMLKASGLNRLEFEVTRVMADADAVVTEGWFRHAYSGAMARAMASAGDVQIDTSAWYLVEYLTLAVWPFDGDLIVGEDLYFATDPRVVRRLEAGEMPHLGPVDRD